jgi:hypothetical protein
VSGPKTTDVATGDFGLRREAKRHAAFESARTSVHPKAFKTAVAAIALPAQSQWVPAFLKLAVRRFIDRDPTETRFQLHSSPQNILTLALCLQALAFWI